MLADPFRMTRSDLVTGPDGRLRCGWAAGETMQRYHDEEWGTPLRGDRALFEKLSLEGFQSGLSWLIVLRKRPAFRAAFADFEPEAVAAFTDADVERLLSDAGIIRNRLKIGAVIANARAVAALRARDGVGALDRLVWSFAPPEHATPESLADVPPRSPESAALATALKAEGLTFVGPVTAYALMQSAGLVDDHLAACFRRQEHDSRTSAQRQDQTGAPVLL